jgi:hypothetical protein
MRVSTFDKRVFFETDDNVPGGAMPRPWLLVREDGTEMHFAFHADLVAWLINRPGYEEIADMNAREAMDQEPEDSNLELSGYRQNVMDTCREYGWPQDAIRAADALYLKKIATRKEG